MDFAVPVDTFILKAKKNKFLYIAQELVVEQGVGDTNRRQCP